MRSEPSVEEIEALRRRNLFARLAWIFLSAFVVWNAVIFFWVHRYLVFWEFQHFIAERRVVLEHYGRAAADAHGDERALAEALRPLVWEFSSRYVILQMPRGGPAAYQAGDLPPDFVLEALSQEAARARGFLMMKVGRGRASCELVLPVIVDSHTAGILRWGLWNSHEKEWRKTHFWRLFWTWFWAAFGGVLLTVFFLRQWSLHKT